MSRMEKMKDKQAEALVHELRTEAFLYEDQNSPLIDLLEEAADTIEAQQKVIEDNEERINNSIYWCYREDF